MNNIPRSIQKILLAATLLAGIIILSQCSLLTVNVVGGGSGKFTYSLLRQGETSPGLHQTSSRSITRLLSSGSYEVLVKNADKSGYSVVKTGLFFRKTTLNINLSPENKRQFIGDNPAPCTILTSNLYSYECGGNFSTINAHIPATASQPGYTQNITNPTIEGVLEGTFWSNGLLFGLVHPFDSEGPGAHVLYQLSDSLTPVSSTSLQVLNSTLDYKVLSYKNGFVAYDQSLKSIYYFSAPGAAPTTISLTPASGLKPISLSAGGDAIVAVFGSQDTQTANDASAKSSKASSQIMVYRGGSVRSYSLSGPLVSRALLCDKNTLCVQTGNNNAIYDISGAKAKLIYKIGDVYAAEYINGNVYFIRSDGVLALKPASRAGFYSYSLGDYKYCGLQPSSDGYILCVIDKNKRLALHVSTNLSNNDSIDKKIQQLNKSKYVSDVSVYGQYIYITPSLGELQYRPEIKGYDYNPSTKEKASNEINNLIKSLDLEQLGYKVTNTIK